MSTRDSLAAILLRNLIPAAIALAVLWGILWSLALQPVPSPAQEPQSEITSPCNVAVNSELRRGVPKVVNFYARVKPGIGRVTMCDYEANYGQEFIRERSKCVEGAIQFEDDDGTGLAFCGRLDNQLGVSFRYHEVKELL